MKFKYSTLREDREEFVDYCESLQNKDLSTKSIHEYSTLLNKYYPKNAQHGSHAMNQWLNARSNLDTLFSLNGIKPPQHPTKVSQILVGVTIGLVVGIVLILIEPYFGGNLGKNSNQTHKHVLLPSPIQQKKQELTINNIPKQNPPLSNNSQVK